jgi:hypothetical protein
MFPSVAGNLSREVNTDMMIYGFPGQLSDDLLADAGILKKSTQVSSTWYPLISPVSLGSPREFFRGLGLLRSRMQL